MLVYTTHVATVFVHMLLYQHFANVENQMKKAGSEPINNPTYDQLNRAKNESGPDVLVCELIYNEN